MRRSRAAFDAARSAFPFLFGGTFIEAGSAVAQHDFWSVISLSFSEGLSLRLKKLAGDQLALPISLPFREGFH